MSFTESISTCLSKYATFSGRASRSEYWWFVLFNVLASVLATMVTLGTGTVWAQRIVTLGLLLPNLAVLVRRLHDSDRSGGWVLTLLAFGGGLGAFVAFAAATTPGMGVASMLLVLLGLTGVLQLVIFVFTLLGSTPGSNRHGDSGGMPAHQPQAGSGAYGGARHDPGYSLPAAPVYDKPAASAPRPYTSPVQPATRSGYSYNDWYNPDAPSQYNFPKPE